jgi:hypothetical protein
MTHTFDGSYTETTNIKLYSSVSKPYSLVPMNIKPPANECRFPVVPNIVIFIVLVAKCILVFYLNL